MVNGKGRKRGRKVGMVLAVKVRESFRKKKNEKEFRGNLWAKVAVSVKWYICKPGC